MKEQPKFEKKFKHPNQIGANCGGAIGLLRDPALGLRGVGYLHMKDYVYHGFGFDSNALY